MCMEVNQIINQSRYSVERERENQGRNVYVSYAASSLLFMMIVY